MSIVLGSVSVDPTSGAATGSGLIFDLYNNIATAQAAVVPNPVHSPSSTLTANLTVGQTTMFVDQTTGWNVGGKIQIGPLYTQITALTTTSITFADASTTNQASGTKLGWQGTEAAWTAAVNQVLIATHQGWAREAIGHATSLFNNYGQAQGASRYSIVDRVIHNNLVTMTAGTVTVGVKFTSNIVQNCDGIRFAWGTTAGMNVRASLWDGSTGTRLAYLDQTCANSGVYRSLFASAVPMTAGHSYVATVYGAADYPSAADTALFGDLPFNFEPSITLTDIRLIASGDAYPTGDSTSLYFGVVEPLILQG